MEEIPGSEPLETNQRKELGTSLSDVEQERRRLTDRLSRPCPHDQDVTMLISQKWGSNTTHQELLNIAKILEVQTHIHLDRDARRRKSVLKKWFAENWDAFHRYFDFLILFGDSHPPES
jgi:hypothetical protein